MKEKLCAFFAQYRKPLITMCSLLVLLPLGTFLLSLYVVRSSFLTMPVSTETAKITAAASQTSEPLLETIQETLPETVPPTTAPPETEPPATEPPEQAMIGDVPFYTQRSLLPTGCELVSAKMLLEYYTHEEIDIHEITDRVNAQYPKMVDGYCCAPHPSQAFIGDPWDPTSFGCFAPVVCDMMNELLPGGFTALDTTGKPLSALAETYIPQGSPVLVWATICMMNTYPNMGWYLTDADGKPTKEWYDWSANEHCLVLIGYDQDFYYFNDPYAWGVGTRYSRSLVEQRWEEMGKYSVVVVKDGSGTKKQKEIPPLFTEQSST